MPNINTVRNILVAQGHSADVLQIGERIQIEPKGSTYLDELMEDLEEHFSNITKQGNRLYIDYAEKPVVCRLFKNTEERDAVAVKLEQRGYNVRLSGLVLYAEQPAVLHVENRFKIEFSGGKFYLKQKSSTGPSTQTGPYGNIREAIQRARALDPQGSYSATDIGGR